MLVELYGKGGKVCEQARQGQIRCPLIVRPTSEDQITGEIFQVLRAINARHWLPQLLNRALGVVRFRQQVYRQLAIDLWVNQPRYPKELLPWTEGSTQVDVTISWENPPTTIYLEMKYGADVSPKTTGGGKQCQYPSDQLIRNIRVGLWRAGWFQEETLFRSMPRDFVMVLVGPKKGHPLVQQYRTREEIEAAIPHAEKLQGVPRSPFVGELSFRDIIDTLQESHRWLTRPERILVTDLVAYLRHKLNCVSSARHGVVLPCPRKELTDPQRSAG